ncbi:murein transglycosylase [Acetobacter pomorum]|uniref:Murein transglycosylase n=1 Tax=Acetobacter pomorum TaxID=65959 RepID=A0A2G4RBH8_9PROT|nr:transglycosylase SLT domain-containing protein [Acetobacter pomorum]PHY93928.1 murein transglycosylase [Acetobacter pomorum]GBR45751.1 murein transglycosylase [Acetobacter pomorum DSM 11825]
MSVRMECSLPVFLRQQKRFLIAFASLAMLAGCASQPRSSYNPPGPAVDKWGPYIQEASTRFSIPQAWIRAVMQQESGGHQYMHGHLTRSVHGAVGLMQIKPDTYHELAKRYQLGSDPYNPHDNIMAGSGYIRQLYDRFGSPDFLAAYSCGPQCMENHRTRHTALPSYAKAYLAAVSPHLNDPVPNTLSPANAIAIANTQPPATAAPTVTPPQQQVATIANPGIAPPLTDTMEPSAPSTADNSAIAVSTEDNTQMQPTTATYQAVNTVPMSGPAMVWQQNPTNGNAIIQIGAFSSQERAQHAIQIAHQSTPALASAVDRIDRVSLKNSGQSVWRSRLAGLPSAQTDTICMSLKQQGLNCVAVTR